MNKMKKILLSLVLALSVQVSLAATYYGTNATSTQNTTPAAKVPARENHGGLRVSYDEFTPTANLTGVDVVNLMKIPQGAKVYEVIVHSDELEASINTAGLSLGVTANGSGIQTANSQLFMNAADVTGGDLEYRLTNDRNVAGNGTVLLAETQVVLTPHSNLGASLGKKIKVWVYYSVN